MTESVIDFPKEGLCPDIWEKVVSVDGMQEIWRLRRDVKEYLSTIYHFLAQKLGFNEYIVHITGSITSNSYTEVGDIDLHLLCKEVPENESDEINKQLREAFKEFKAADPTQGFVGKHPVEVYFQANEFQDYMSVGCYDVIKDLWEVGPELANPMFNPYSEYYKEVEQKSQLVVSNIRQTILDVYEKAIICQKIKDKNNQLLHNEVLDVLEAKLKSA